MILVALGTASVPPRWWILRWDQVDFNAGTMAVRRIKEGSPSTHPIRSDELRPAQARPGARPEVTIRLHVRAWRGVVIWSTCEPVATTSADDVQRRWLTHADPHLGLAASLAALTWLSIMLGVRWTSIQSFSSSAGQVPTHRPSSSPRLRAD